MLLAHAQLEEPLQRESRQERQIPCAARAHHCRRTSSEPKPGPIARRRPRLPGGGRRSASVSASTKSTEALERFPTSRRLRQLSASASRGTSSASSKASSSRGPPGWQTKVATSASERAAAGQELVHVLADPECQARHVAGEHHAKALAPDLPAHRTLGSGVEDRARR